MLAGNFYFSKTTNDRSVEKKKPKPPNSAVFKVNLTQL